MKKEITEIRIYVACLASYNNGILHGRWIDATCGADHIFLEIADMLKNSPAYMAEEFSIHDYEGFKDIRLSEYECINQVCDYAEFIEEHGELGAKLFEHLGDLDDAKSYLENNYFGEYKSVADYAESLTEETTEIPESLRYYIDYKAMAHDMEINDVLAIELRYDEVHIFGRY
jgi:antirestriction protein